MSFKFINPSGLGAPRGYSNGVLTDTGGRLLFVAGQVAWDDKQAIVSDDFAAQFDRALANVLTVVEEAGGSAEHIVRFLIFVTDKYEYLENLKQVGDSYRARMGRHYPAMALVEVKALVEDRAKVEIEAIAVL
jgi:enamine deaminase RidA (YjgF/YER057c/UK114 family)